MSQKTPPSKPSVVKPMLACVIGIVLFMLPFLYAFITDSSDPAGLSAFVIGVVVWPLGFVLGLSGLLIVCKRLVAGTNK